MKQSVLVFVIAIGATATPALAQEHTSRWELTEQFIRDMWLHPIRAMNVTVLGPGPVHAPTDDCEIHIGAMAARKNCRRSGDAGQ